MDSLPSPAYWQSLSFAYATTYSLLRGPKWERLRTTADQLAATLRASLLTASAAELPALRAQLECLRRYHRLEEGTLTEGRSAYHITASPVATLTRESAETQELARILSLAATNVIDFMCAPVYRDALAFYNSRHELVGVLNICFGCNRMQTENGQNITADASVYDELRQLLWRLGHIIENEDGPDH